MLKRDLEKKLAQAEAENDRIRKALDLAVDGLNDLSVGLGRTRNGKWSASYLAADTLTEMARLWVRRK